MTRPLHVETKVQRGDHPSAEQRVRGYEPSDASPWKVLLAAACFVALMVLGLGFAAATLGWLEGRDEQPRDVGRGLAISPPPPNLDSHPLASRRRYDAAMDRRMDDAALGRAGRDIMRRGWGEAKPAPPVKEEAHAHREAAR